LFFGTEGVCKIDAAQSYSESTEVERMCLSWKIIDVQNNKQLSIALKLDTMPQKLPGRFCIWKALPFD